MPVAGPSTMPMGAPAARRDERAVYGRSIPPRLAKEPMYPPGLCNFGPKDSNIRPPANRPVPSRFNNHYTPRATYPPRNYTPRPPGYSIRDEICNNYQQGRCIYGPRCYRRHVLPPEYKVSAPMLDYDHAMTPVQHVEDYNPPPVKPIHIEPEAPPGLPKKPMKPAAGLDGEVKVCTSPSEVTIDEVVSSAGQGDSSEPMTSHPHF
ncbi:hypothetical protein EV421DRAFT_343117 [Armillaria borealis]|uniref:C3H1-type domain-containing protein n=1 Tax=Armillaria borealis TaxID=47425 RepID=A0AA39MTF4_9AGAR|nr:hypothetical protein EV421DRAFT_343117 [Armillaria borealis]